jgi:hypothetical protein
MVATAVTVVTVVVGGNGGSAARRSVLDIEEVRLQVGTCRAWGGKDG